PEDSFHGVDFIVPDMSYLLDEPESVRAVLLSHGHEDHIGALPHLFQKVKCPVYGTRLTLGFARERLEEYRIDTHANDLRAVRPGDVIEAGPFKVEFLQVTHSIPDAVPMPVRTPPRTIAPSPPPIPRSPGRGWTARRSFWGASRSWAGKGPPRSCPTARTPPGRASRRRSARSGGRSSP